MSRSLDPRKKGSACFSLSVRHFFCYQRDRNFPPDAFALSSARPALFLTVPAILGVLSLQHRDLSPIGATAVCALFFFSISLRAFLPP